ncbi:MAG: hypothetical protein RL217_693 [Pseudomonadota bacterium]|jgi:hypothetical protein
MAKQTQLDVKTIILGILVAGAAAAILWLAFSPSSLENEKVIETPPVALPQEAPPTPQNDAQPPQFESDPNFVKEGSSALNRVSGDEKIEEITTPLGQSDRAFLDAVQNLAPSVAGWLIGEQQIRKWVLVVDAVAEHKVPTADRPINYPVGKFLVQERGETLTIRAENHGRAQAMIDTITAIPPKQLARFYRQFSPLFEQAYAELGREDRFSTRLNLAIENVLSIPTLRQLEEVKQPAVFYVYANKDLEQSDKLSKFFWRLGPENTLRVQQYLADLQKQL